MKDKPKGPFAPAKILKRVPKKKMTANAKTLSGMRKRLARPQFPAAR